MSAFWLVTYDISNDRARRQVADCLENHGHRVQFSVFECHITRQQLYRLRDEVKEIIGREDSVRWYPVCKFCVQKIGRQGIGVWTDDPDFFRV